MMLPKEEAVKNEKRKHRIKNYTNTFVVQIGLKNGSLFEIVSEVENIIIRGLAKEIA